MIVLSALEEYRRLNQIRLPSGDNELSASRRSGGGTATAASSSQSLWSDTTFEISQHGSVSFPEASMQSSSNNGSTTTLTKNRSTRLDRQESWESTASMSTPSPSRAGRVQTENTNLTEASSITFRDEINRPNDPTCCFQFRSILGGKFRNILGGTIGVILAGVSTFIIFIIGCSLAPSGSLDVKDVLSLGLESGRTYADAVDDFNVFRMISLVFLKARFVLSSTSDYVGLGILFFLGFITVILFPVMQGWKKFQEWRNNSVDDDIMLSQQQQKVKKKAVIPGFTNRLKVYHHMEVYIISFCIANWQLGAVVAYALHNYCFLLQRFYESLAYVGLVDHTESNCFQHQAADPLTSVIFVGSFSLLLASFIMQMLAQYKKNKKHAGEFLEEDYNNDRGREGKIVENLESQAFDVVVMKKNFEPSYAIIEENEAEI